MDLKASGSIPSKTDIFIKKKKRYSRDLNTRPLVPKSAILAPRPHIDEKCLKNQKKFGYIFSNSKIHSTLKCSIVHGNQINRSGRQFMEKSHNKFLGPHVSYWIFVCMYVAKITLKQLSYIPRNILKRSHLWLNLRIRSFTSKSHLRTKDLYSIKVWQYCLLHRQLFLSKIIDSFVPD